MSTKRLFFIVLFGIIVCHNTLAEVLRISPEQLKEQLSDQSLIILDTRNADAYEAGHIQGAYNFPIQLTYHNQKINGKISLPAITQTQFRAHGINKNSRVVVYDNGNLVDAARLFWVLEVYSIGEVKVLDHGYDDWINKSYPISLQAHTATPSHYVASLNYKRLASKFSTQLATKNSHQLIIDARSVAEYRGDKSTAKRYGHIPTAISIPFAHNISTVQGFATFKPLNELSQIYSDIPKNQKVIIYCAMGRISSVNYLALRELDYNVANYDASWNEWRNDDKLPIEK
jgi:thiosulfate/3-mercaptopyruvate sulfurtransferase